MKVAILGASDKPDRYSNMALKMLVEKGHTVFPVHPRLKEIDGIAVIGSLKDLPAPVHTVTVYLSPELSGRLEGEIIESKPRRVIFNPGTENAELAKSLDAAGIVTLEACTLVLLRTGQFDTAGAGS